jgi:hypothetical protein
MVVMVLRIFVAMAMVVEEYNDVVYPLVMTRLNYLLLLMIQNWMKEMYNQDLIVHQNHLLLNLFVVEKMVI